LTDCQNEVSPEVDGRWVLQWAGQAVLTISHINWTREVEKAIQENNLSHYLTIISRVISEQSKILGEDISLNNRIMLGKLEFTD
jgi:hypothetical protein